MLECRQGPVHTDWEQAAPRKHPVSTCSCHSPMVQGSAQVSCSMSCFTTCSAAWRCPASAPKPHAWVPQPLHLLLSLPVG